MTERDSNEPVDDGERHAEPPPPSKTDQGTVMMEPEPKKPAGKKKKKQSKTPQGTVMMDPTATPPPRASGGTVMMDRSSEGGRASRLSTLSGLRNSRTTIHEVGQIAQRLSVIQSRVSKVGEPNIIGQLSISFAVSVTLVLLVTMIFAGGSWRLVLGILGGTTGTTLAVWGTLRSLPKLAKWMGPRTLPGPALLWVAGFVVAAGGATIAFTWSVSEATKRYAIIAVPEKKRPEPVVSAAPPPAPDDGARADRDMKRGTHVKVRDGVLYVPPSFESADGHFDLLVHYHGNVDLVKESVDAVELNAILYVINFGEFSGRYSEPLRNPRAFDEMLGHIEEKTEEGFALERPRIRRVALSSWSAGFGAVYHILASRSRLDRVDALLMMDSLHASFQPGSETAITPLSLEPFVKFAERAVAGEKLFVLTHSAVETRDYPSTTQSADGLLESVGVERDEVSPDDASPPPVDFDVALKAFPSKERDWMRVTSEAKKGKLVVLGCSGDGRGDHIAHLAQMSVTVLPHLREHWK